MIYSLDNTTMQKVIDDYKFSEMWNCLSEGSKIAYRKPIDRLLALYDKWSVTQHVSLSKTQGVARSLPSQAQWSSLVRSLPVSNAEKNKTFIVLNAIYQGAELGKMKFKALDHTIVESSPWTREDIEKLWNTSMLIRLRIAVAFLRFCFYSGMRPWCEAALLERPSLSQSVLSVMGSKRREKGAVARMVPILPEMRECLEFIGQMVPAALNKNLVWVNEHGRRLNKGTISTRLMEACSLAGIECREMYDARRGLATAMLRQGYSLDDVANQLGHKDIATTKRYDQRTMEEKALNFRGIC